ncbi:hypothetical protein vBAbaMPhT2_208 [Acinetobacter phage vB_AbaM_PhT2]|uniref:Uncharacterized protein n=1 Tax=Acinetobacter phage vB_AbaM_PhT2 TaxID=2690230 RepID=A0A6B9SW97_9CAUD|nr:membrane protein [Acinetobacter phage vB_AbaM_PhT2]QHJ75811.1 hypothetical protein vBAbaMPhT2_208 [Acinetobacter phage vB_AbaM_PhT2]
MEIKKSSWHYRFIKWSSDGKTPPKNLCAYVRTLLIRLIIFGAILAIATIICFAIGISLFIMCNPYTGLDIVAAGAVFENPLWVNIVAVPIGFATFIAIVAASFGAVFGIGYGSGYVYKRIKRANNASGQKSIFTTYISDKHKKICRHLEFKD